EHGAKTFRFQAGPIFANLVLADEVNRATPKTQSAILEAMQEHSVTIGGRTHALPDPFWVLATQNPIEMEGTYPLPEAQIDRFGVSPRGVQALILASKVRALLHGRFNISCEDVREVARPALRHRIIRNFEAEADGISTDKILDRLLDSVAEPAAAA